MLYLLGTFLYVAVGAIVAGGRVQAAGRKRSGGLPSDFDTAAALVVTAGWWLFLCWEIGMYFEERKFARRGTPKPPKVKAIEPAKRRFALMRQRT